MERGELGGGKGGDGQQQPQEGISHKPSSEPTTATSSWRSSVIKMKGVSTRGLYNDCSVDTLNQIFLMNHYSS